MMLHPNGSTRAAQKTERRNVYIFSQNNITCHNAEGVYPDPIPQFTFDRKKTGIFRNDTTFTNGFKTQIEELSPAVIVRNEALFVQYGLFPLFLVFPSQIGVNWGL
jgi:hypothetical protein